MSGGGSSHAMDLVITDGGPHTLGPAMDSSNTAGGPCKAASRGPCIEPETIVGQTEHSRQHSALWPHDACQQPTQCLCSDPARAGCGLSKRLQSEHLSKGCFTVSRFRYPPPPLPRIQLFLLVPINITSRLLRHAVSRLRFPTLLQPIKSPLSIPRARSSLRDPLHPP
eukprot:419562-Rhodomonas_salina.1